jgi:hypothetical protein
MPQFANVDEMFRYIAREDAAAVAATPPLVTPEQQAESERRQRVTEQMRAAELRHRDFGAISREATQRAEMAATAWQPPAAGDIMVGVNGVLVSFAYILHQIVDQPGGVDLVLSELQRAGKIGDFERRK